jgi:hypothetical protein
MICSTVIVVVADLEGDHRPDIQRDALLGDALFSDLALAHGQRQESGLAEEGEDEGAMTCDHAERGIAF